MAQQVNFFLVVHEAESEKLPDIIELASVPPWTPDPRSGDADAGTSPRPQISPPLVLGRGSPCLLWALKNSLACSRRLLQFTTWSYPREMERGDSTTTTTASAHGRVSAHPSAAAYAVRVSSQDLNRLVHLRRRTDPHAKVLPTPPRGGKGGGDSSGIGEGGVAWLQVGDSLTVADKVTLSLGALRLITVPAAEAPPGCCSDAGHQHYANTASSGPLCWFAGSDMGSCTSSGENSGEVSHAGPSTTVSRPPPPPLPQVGIRPGVSWRELPHLTRLEMMHTCWSKWTSSSRLPVSWPTSRVPSRSPARLSVTPVSKAPVSAAGPTLADKGVQTSPALLARVGDDAVLDLALVEKAPPPLSDSSRSSATAGDVNRDGDGLAIVEAGEAATPGNSQSQVLLSTTKLRGKPRHPSPGTSQGRREGRGMGPRPWATSGSQQQETAPSQVSVLSSPPTFLTAVSRHPQQQRLSGGVVARPYSLATGTSNGSDNSGGSLRGVQPQPSSAPSQSPLDEQASGGANGNYTFAESYDAHLDYALAALEQEAEELDHHLTPRPAMILGEEAEEEEADGDYGDGDLGGHPADRATPTERGQPRTSSSRTSSGRKAAKYSRRSGSGTPRNSSKRHRRQPPQQPETSSTSHTSSRTSRVTAQRRSLADLDLRLHGSSSSSRMRRSASGLIPMSGPPTLHPPPTGNDPTTAKASAGRATGYLQRGEESQEVFYQH